MTHSNGGVKRPPLVSLGIPAYNAERFLARAIDSLLEQTLSDFELIISDNASTDGTRAICERYAREDGRIRYVRQPHNIGAARNWNVVARAARGAFFKWASANDYCAPIMLEKCVAVLQADPGVVLCYGRTQLIDEHERPLEIYDGDLVVDDDRPSDRFARVCRLMGLNNAQSGVIRQEVLRRTRLDRPYPSGDVALMAELALYGRFQMVPEVLLYRRQSVGTFWAMRSPLERVRFNDPDAKVPLRLVLARRHMDHVAILARAPIPVREKLRAYRSVLRLIRWDRVNLWREFRSLFRRPRIAG
jgi:glycosyltransferase involved in cell wall biosynthesis